MNSIRNLASVTLALGFSFFLISPSAHSETKDKPKSKAEEFTAACEKRLKETSKKKPKTIVAVCSCIERNLKKKETSDAEFEVLAASYAGTEDSPVEGEGEDSPLHIFELEVATSCLKNQKYSVE